MKISHRGTLLATALLLPACAVHQPTAEFEYPPLHQSSTLTANCDAAQAADAAETVFNALHFAVQNSHLERFGIRQSSSNDVFHATAAAIGAQDQRLLVIADFDGQHPTTITFSSDLSPSQHAYILNILKSKLDTMRPRRPH